MVLKEAALRKMFRKLPVLAVSGGDSGAVAAAAGVHVVVVGSSL